MQKAILRNQTSSATTAELTRTLLACGIIAGRCILLSVCSRHLSALGTTSRGMT